MSVENRKGRVTDTTFSTRKAARGKSSRENAITAAREFQDLSVEAAIALALSRYSVLDLVEQSRADLDNAESLLSRSSKPIFVVSSIEINYIRAVVLRSDGKTYETRRFEDFCFCSCHGFFYSKRACKHLAFTASSRYLVGSIGADQP